MDKLLKILFFALVVKPVVLILLGLNVRGKSNLPVRGPAVIAANHNSHLDTLVLMSLYPLAQMSQLRPVAAADYFLKNNVIKWFSLRIIGIIPLDRSGTANLETLFDECHDALDREEILLIFPEGSRGNPEERGDLKKGLFHLVKDRAAIAVTPVLMHGLGRALPKGEALLVPFNCDVVIGEPMSPQGSSAEFLSELQGRYDSMLEHCITHHTDSSES